MSNAQHITAWMINSTILIYFYYFLRLMPFDAAAVFIFAIFSAITFSCHLHIIDLCPHSLRHLFNKLVYIVDCVASHSVARKNNFGWEALLWLAAVVIWKQQWIMHVHIIITRRFSIISDDSLIDWLISLKCNYMIKSPPIFSIVSKGAASKRLVGQQKKT